MDHADEPEQGPDHLAALFMQEGAASSGSYTPERVTLKLAGTDADIDRIVYLHEAHHAALNDSTAWGAALQILAALTPVHRTQFAPLLDACRRPHEAYATFASVNIAGAHTADVTGALEHYPRYASLHATLAGLVEGSGGPHRRYLAATAIARATMQTPILEQMLSDESLLVRLSDLRRFDTPNERWRWLIGPGRSEVDAAFAAANCDADDHALGLDDGQQIEAAASDELDPAWQRWEQVAYSRLAESLTAAGARVLAFNGHMRDTDAAIARAKQIDPRLTLRAARPGTPAPDDRSLSAATAEQVRLTLTELPRPARLLFDPVETIELAKVHGRIDDVRYLVTSASLPRRLLESFSWSQEDRAALQREEGPVAAVRTVVADDEGSCVVQSVLGSPDELRQLTDSWRSLGSSIAIAAASVFVDQPWAARWLPALRAHDALIVQIDIGADRFIRSWAASGATVRVGSFRIEDTSGVFWANCFQIGDGASLWVHLGDELTVKLVREQIRLAPEIDLVEDLTHLKQHSATLQPVFTHLLATESFFDLQGLDDETLRRVTERKLD